MQRNKDHKGKADDKSNAIIVALPGDATVETKLVDQAVVELNNLYRATGLAMARAVGEYVLTTFFGGDTANFKTRGNAHASFRELTKRDELHVLYLFIWNAVSVVDQLRLLPKDIGEAIPLSHHKLLLPIKDAKKKLALAKTAIDEGLGKRDFEERVKVVRAEDVSDSKVGRPSLPAFAKAFTALHRVAKIATSERITKDSFEHVSMDAAKKMLKEAEKELAALAKLVERVREHVVG